MTKRPATIAALLLFASLPLGLSGCHDATFHNMYNSKQEKQIGAEMATEIAQQEKFDLDPKDNTRIQGIAIGIFAQAQKMRSDVQYQIRIIDSPEVNAFSLPGGYIYIYTGLMDKIGDDDDALACVIGHETAHVVRKHAVTQLTDASIKGDLISVVGVATNNATAYNALSSVNDLMQLHYSREDEYEADKYGLMFAYNAGYDPNGMLRMFKKLEEVEKETGSQPAYAEDHPITKNRELRATDLIKELRADDGRYPDMPAPITGPSGAPTQTPVPTPAPTEKTGQ